jgi:hypothetical protein
MSGKYCPTIVPGLSAGGAVLTSLLDIANTTAPSFSTVCSPDNNDPGLRAFKDSAETFTLNITRAAEVYNAIFFSVDELHATLDRYCNTSPGSDGIRNEMLSHLPPAGREFLLSVCNRIWTFYSEARKRGLYVALSMFILSVLS